MAGLSLRKRLSEIWTCRHILVVLMILCFIIIGMLSIHFSIAIVAMTKKSNNQENTFNWTESEKQEILGIFFWGYTIAKIPGGIICESVGPKRVIIFSVFIAGLITLLTPTIAFWNYYALLVSRVLLGISLATVFPSFLPLTANWFRPSSQSKFLTCMEAYNTGITISHFVGGLLISSWGWIGVFYVTGGLALLWSSASFLLIYDSPEAHPRISDDEKAEIMNHLAASVVVRAKFKEIPWKNIFASKAVWAIGFAQIAMYNLQLILSAELPLYVDQVLEIELNNVGLYASIPFLGSYFVSVIFGYAADKLYNSKKIANLTLRKIFETIGLLLPAVCMIILALKGDNTAIAMTALTFAVLLSSGACVGGHFVNILDLAPNYSSIISGFVFTLGTFTTYFITKIVALFLKDGHTFQEWRNLFWLLCGINLTGWLVYVNFASVQLQSWNSKHHDITPENR